MLRSKLVAVFSILLGLVLGMAGLLFLGAKQSSYYFERSLSARDALEGYMALSMEAYRHFKQLADTLVLGEAENADDAVATEAAVRRSLEELRARTVREIALVQGTDEQEEEEKELERVARLGELIERGLREFAEAAALQREGRRREAWLAASRVLERTIDDELAAVIDDALADERREVARADRRAGAVAATLTATAGAVALLATLFVVAAAAWLVRGIKRPIDRLMEGTRRIAAGDLGHRIAAASGRDEFAQLATSFNVMAADLERQRRQLIDARTHLEEEVARRTGELHDANQELQRLDRVRRRLYADISHELRTPLTVVRGEAEVTLRGRRRTVAEYRTALQRIVALTEQLTRLVDDLLLLARSETATVRLELRPVALGPLLAEIGEDAAVLARERDIAVVPRLDAAAEVVVAGDRQRLRQLLLALIDNAYRYTEPGGRITVALAAEGDEAVVTVADTGVGIPPDEIEHVFERFYRSDEARRLAPGGTGLGLSVAKSIVEAHHGGIALTSRRGEGTTATVRLPLVQPAAARHDAHDDPAR